MCVQGKGRCNSRTVSKAKTLAHQTLQFLSKAASALVEHVIASTLRTTFCMYASLSYWLSPSFSSTIIIGTIIIGLCYHNDNIIIALCQVQQGTCIMRALHACRTRISRQQTIGGVSSRPSCLLSTRSFWPLVACCTPSLTFRS